MADKMGARTPGRNICRDGWSDRRGATIPEKQKGLEHLRVMLAPPPVSTSQPVSASVTSGACGGITPYSGGGHCWAIPYSIVLCESGGSYTAYNPSGAAGAYQLLGHGTTASTPPAEQDAVAAELWAGGAGASNWVCAG